MRRVEICNGGIAALCCAELLSRRDWNVRLQCTARGVSPTVVINPITIKLIKQVFGDHVDIFEDAHRLYRRHVFWGTAKNEVISNDASVVMRGNLLIERLLASLNGSWGTAIDSDAPVGFSNLDNSACTWTILTGSEKTIFSDKQKSRVVRRFGERCTIVSEVSLKNDIDATAYLIESTPGGWVFLAPTNQYSAVLQSVIPTRPENPLATQHEALKATSLIKTSILQLPETATVFDSSPKLLTPLYGSNWIAVGSLACAYDPLCGDGIGYAVRQAILASAVLEAIENGVDRKRCLEHYQNRLAKAFYNHLQACWSFYSSAEFDNTWATEVRETLVGLTDLDQEVRQAKPWQYALRDFELVRIQDSVTH